MHRVLHHYHHGSIRRTESDFATVDLVESIRDRHKSGVVQKHPVEITA